MPRDLPPYQIRQFGTDVEANDWITAQALLGYRLTHIAGSSIRTYDRDLRREAVDHAVWVAMERL